MNFTKTVNKKLWEPLKKTPTYNIAQIKGHRGIWFLDYRDLNGKRIRKSLSTRSKREANARRKIWIEYVEKQ